MTMIRFTKDHEWIRVEDGEGAVGITDYAQQQLGDVVFVELPEVGARFNGGDEAAVVESVKAASEIYAPAAGEVTAVNSALDEDPGKVNSSPDDEGWFFRLKLDDEGEIDDLMDEEAYQAFLKDLE